MRRLLLGLAVCLLGGTDARAGLYNPNEPDEGKLAVTPREIIQEFRARLGDLRSIPLKEVQYDNPLRRRYVLVAELAQAKSIDKLSLEQKIALSATYLRRGQAGQALQLLLDLQRQHPDNILVLSNLATAYQQTGEFDRASETLKHLLRDVWPADFGDLKEPQRQFLESIGWHQALYEWYRKVETYHVKLLRQRVREKLRPVALKDEQPYALFDDGKSPPAPVQFVGPSGKYEAGQVKTEEKAKLPRDAIDIVQQLLIWMPDDSRLYWLLGELCNARGTPDDIRAAHALFDDLVDLQKRQYRPQQLVEHYRVLQDNVQPANVLLPRDLDPRIDDEIEKQDKDKASAAFDWRNLLVGFGAGLVVALFGMWQVKEIRRRRQVRQPV